MKKNLFLVHTPFQLMNCLNIIENNYKSDLNDIVFLHKNMKQYSSLIKKYNKRIQIYNYEFLFNDYANSNSLKTKLSLVFSLIKGKKAIRKVDNRNKLYDFLFIPSENIDCNLTYNYFHELNNSLELCVYDDGVGTYAKGYLKGEKYFKYKLISNILFGSFFWKDIKKVFCYQPEFIDDRNIDVEKIKIKSEKKIERLFSENLDERLINKYDSTRIIYLDQGQLPKSIENTKIFLEVCKKFYKKSEVILKNHPRVMPVYDGELFETDSSGTTFESIFFNIDIESKVLVSMCSTGCLTPFILNNKFPYIIFLGFLDTDDYENTFSTPYFQNVIKNYRPDKIFIPRDIFELEKVIKFLSESHNN